MSDKIESAPARSALAPVEDDRPVYMLSKQEFKLLFIASTGFFIDAYDLFIINIIVPIVNVLYLNHLSGTINGIPLKGGLLKAGTNIGCVVGQLFFGFAGDYFGRGKVYGKELMVTIFGTILFIAVPNSLDPYSIFTWLTVFRVVMGMGIGGDYPNSSGVVSDRANLRRRGTMLAFVFSFQGIGNLMGALLAIIVLEIYRSSIFVNKHVSHLNSVWRLLAGLILVPALGTLYQRLRLGESDRMKHVQAMRADPTLIKQGHYVAPSETGSSSPKSLHEKPLEQDAPVAPAASAPATSQKWETLKYFSEWRHAKLLIGTAGSWFLVDITFYGINLNQSIVIQAIGLADSKDPWQYLFDLAKANIIIAAAGFVPGYYLTMLTIEKFGRKNIQFYGFLANALFLGVLAGAFKHLRSQPAAFVVVFALLQLSFNFGPNSTTFIVPAEIFPTRVRGGAHGFSAACGKCGAIITALAFPVLNTKIGTANVLWIFFGISFLGAACTLLIVDTTARDPDVIDLQERQEAAGYASRVLEQ